MMVTMSRYESTNGLEPRFYQGMHQPARKIVVKILDEQRGSFLHHNNDGKRYLNMKSYISRLASP